MVKTEKLPGSIRGDAANVMFILREAWRLNARACATSFLETLARIMGAFQPLLLGIAVGSLVAHRLAPGLTALAVLGLALGTGMLLSTLGVHERLRLYEAVGHEFDQRTGRFLAAPPTLDHFEDPAYLDRFQVFRDRPGVLGMAFNMIANCANSLATPVFLIGSAIAADWRMAVVAAAGGLTLLTTRLQRRWDKQAEEESATPSRQSEGWLALALDPTASAELRVFGARPWLLQRLRGATSSWLHALTRASAKEALLGLVIDLVYFTIAGVVLLWIVADAVAGRVTPGRLTVALSSVNSLAGAFGSLVWALSSLAGLTRNLRRYRALESYADAHAGTGTILPPQRLTCGISLRGVDFAYPGSDELALSGVDLELPPGAVVAVVGENGAGKSTLVKLLTGMYDLRGGTIRVDGVDLRDLDIAAWRGRCSGAFQDHLQLHTSALEAITVGDMPALGDEARAARALEEAAATDVLRALPDGLATELGSEFGGVELSGGQWQRLAIARGLMRQDPLLLVLDEPTSALDPATEHRLFEGYAAAARETGGRGGVTLLVTHRFSTVAAADLVVVLADGRVAEVGTHADLIAAGGRYAQLYELQARGYR